MTGIARHAAIALLPPHVVAKLSCGIAGGTGQVSEDETIVLLVGGGLALFCAGNWYYRLSMPSLLPDRGRLRLLLALAPVVGSLGVVAVLMTMAASDVRNAPEYVFLYAAVGTAWVCGAGLSSVYLGVSLRDDVVERHNPAAALMIVAAILSQAIIYSGANVGNGPGWWVVLISGSIAAGCWVIIWLVVNGAVGLHERITVDRDVPAAIRLGALMLAVGWICGRGAAGDWVSFERTVEEFAVIWPAGVIAALAIATERTLRGQKIETSVPFAMLVGLAWLVIAAYAIAASPPLTHNPDYALASISVGSGRGDAPMVMLERTSAPQTENGP